LGGIKIVDVCGIMVWKGGGVEWMIASNKYG